MKIPFIKIKQKGEVFYITKINALKLRDHVNFEFRDPYLKNGNSKDIMNYNKYISSIEKKGLKIKGNPKAIQRKLQLDRINSIRNYLEDNVINFFPNSVILSLITDENNIEVVKYLEDNETGELEIPNNSNYNIIDGQHRLAGIFSSNENIIKDFDIPVILLIDISVSNAVKLFLDINSNQKQVNKSVVYDLYEDLEENEINEIKKIHIICQKLYTNPSSPLYRQIKMLGVGSGAISQAFFIDTITENLRFLNLGNISNQDLYNHLFSYYTAFQKVFPNDWPVPIQHNDNIEELDRYASEVLIQRKSQLVKTTGFGAIMNVFKFIYEEANGDYKKYCSIVKKLQGKINWCDRTGTGKKIQKTIANEILNILINE